MIFAHGMDVLGFAFFFFFIGEGMARHCIANGALFGLSIVLKERYLKVFNDNSIRFNTKQATCPRPTQRSE